MEGNNISVNIPEDQQNESDYTVEMELTNINNILGMYNLNNLNNNNNTSFPNPIPFSGTNYYQSSIDNISQLYDNTEPLYISEIKDMKKNVIDILHKRSEFNDEEYDDEKYDNKEIDELYSKITKVNEEFKELQDSLFKAEENLKGEINKMNNNIIKIDNFIVFLENLSLISDFGDIKEIIKNINTLSNKLSNVESFKKAKKEYTTERKNILKYIYLLRKVNKMNVTNTCIICMEDSVSHFINPCGHTFCKKCLESSLRISDINEEYIIHDGKKCPICRKYLNNIHPLYFL